jgi:hypothetical protein
MGSRFGNRCTLALPALLAMVAATGCKTSPRAPYQFESEPRPVLAMSGIAHSRYARLGVNEVTSATIHLLSVIDGAEKPRIALLTSEDGGDHFGPPVFASAKDADISSHGEDSPALIVTPGEIYAAWNEGEGIRFARSLTWGESFESPVRIDDKVTPAFSGYVSMGLAPDGDIYLVWLDARDEAETPDTFSAYLAKSTNKGASFSRNIRIARSVCPCCRPNLSFGPGGELIVFWRKVYPGSIRDITSAMSSDGGASFSEPVRVAVDDWVLEGCPDSGPATARSGTRVYVAWLTEGSPERSGVRLTWSDDAGRTWAPAVLASQKILDANYPSLSAADDGSVVMVFQGRDPGKQAGWSPYAAYEVVIAKDGRLTTPMSVADNTASVTRPTVVAGPGGRLYTAWTDLRQNHGAVVLLRGRRSAG